MDSARLLGDAGAAPSTSTDETRRLYRIAGLGGVGAFLAWLGQPVLVLLIIGPRGGAGGDWSVIESARYNGAIEVVIFSAVGVGLLFMVLATWRLIGHQTSGTSVAAAVGHVMGVAAAVSWFLVAAEAFRLFTSVGAAIPDVTDDSRVQASIIHGTALDTTGALLLSTVCYTGWVLMVATAGRRAGVVGTPLGVVLALFALGWVPALALPFSVPWPLVGFVFTMLILGVAFLMRSRR